MNFIQLYLSSCIFANRFLQLNRLARLSPLLPFRILAGFERERNRPEARDPAVQLHLVSSRTRRRLAKLSSRFEPQSQLRSLRRDSL